MGSVSRLRGGNQAKKACSFKVSVFGSHVGPGSAKTDSFLCPPPTSSLTGVVAGTGVVQPGASVVCSSGTGTGSFLSQSQTFLLPLSGALTAGVDGGFDLKGELQGGHSSPRFWPEEPVQFQNDEMKGTLVSSGQRSRLRYVAGMRTLSSSVGTATTMAGEHFAVP